MTPHRLISIDTGSYDSAACEWVDGVPTEFWQLPNDLFIDKLRQVVPFFDNVAVEMPQNYGSEVGHDVHMTTFTVGRVAEVALVNHISVTLVGPSTKRAAICGRIQGVTKPMMNSALRVRYGDNSKTGKGTKKAPSALYHCNGSDQWSALAVGATWHILWKVGDLDAQTIVRDTSSLDGQYREVRRGQTPIRAESGPVIDFGELTDPDQVDGQEVEVHDIGDRLKAGKCANPTCQGTIKPGSCKCPVLPRPEFRPDRGDATAAAK